ncbi:MAG TPA: PQQ-binding-like beta-propeller repeat protein [Streptosporangiaceae bacterium]|nr:PQQ-binding-like beta-propeller repeat protein [Streptosporangiaceae bacterium]
MRVPRLAAVPLALAALAGCTSAPHHDSSPVSRQTTGTTSRLTTRPGPARPGTSWPVYHANAARTGYVPGLPAAGPLTLAWRAGLDGAVYGQPLIIGNLVIAATENDTVYGLNRASGRVEWRTHVGTPVPSSALPCGDINPLGITGTPAYDPATGLVYLVAEQTGYHHVLYGLSLTGQVRLRRDIPTPDGQPRFDQQRPALAIDAGRVYVGFGGLYGDCGPYIGSVAGVPASGSGPLISYRVPTASKGAIWGTGGPVIASGTLYVSVGNGAATAPPYDGSDSVIALTPGLRRTGFFAPATWGADNDSDLDLGSMSPALLPGGRILAVGKRGTGYLLDAAHLGGIGGQLAQAAICPAFGGPAVAGSTAYVPCEGGGMAAVATAGDHLRVLWRGPASAEGSPVAGGGAVWVAGWDSGTLYELAQAGGRVRYQIGLGSPLPHFASPSLSGDLVFVGTDTGVTAVRGG